MNTIEARLEINYEYESENEDIVYKVLEQEKARHCCNHIIEDYMIDAAMIEGYWKDIVRIAQSIRKAGFDDKMRMEVRKDIECQWFAGCNNPSERMMPHPIYKQVPVCEDCARLLESTGKH